jgi:hypothetical protein
MYTGGRRAPRKPRVSQSDQRKIASAEIETILAKREVKIARANAKMVALDAIRAEMVEIGRERPLTDAVLVRHEKHMGAHKKLMAEIEVLGAEVGVMNVDLEQRGLTFPRPSPADVAARAAIEAELAEIEAERAKLHAMDAEEISR